MLSTHRLPIVEESVISEGSESPQHTDRDIGVDMDNSADTSEEVETSEMAPHMSEMAPHTSEMGSHTDTGMLNASMAANTDEAGIRAAVLVPDNYRDPSGIHILLFKDIFHSFFRPWNMALGPFRWEIGDVCKDFFAFSPDIRTENMDIKLFCDVFASVRCNATLGEVLLSIYTCFVGFHGRGEDPHKLSPDDPPTKLEARYFLGLQWQRGSRPPRYNILFSESPEQEVLMVSLNIV